MNRNSTTFLLFKYIYIFIITDTKCVHMFCEQASKGHLHILEDKLGDGVSVGYVNVNTSVDCFFLSFRCGSVKLFMDIHPRR